MDYMSAGRLLKLAIAAVVCIAFVAGCNDGGPSTKIFVKKDNGRKLRVAVLPFDNVARDAEAGRVITNTVVTYMLTTGYFDVVEPGVVYAAMGSTGVRTTEGMTPEASAKLQPLLNADIYVTGVVEEYGEVRVGADTYPAVSFSSRLLNARTNEIMWAATISKTGAEGAKIFDIGRISSLGKLSKLAVKAMADSLIKSKAQIFSGVQPGAAASGDAGNGEPSSVSPTATPATTPTPTPAASGGTAAATTAGAKYMDEALVYGEPEMTALLKDVGDAKLGVVRYSKHYHGTIETQYQLTAGGKIIDVKLVDYKKVATAAKFVEQETPSGEKGSFDSHSAVTDTSEFDYFHLNIAAGRFGIYLRGPSAQKAETEALGKGIIALLK